MDWSSTNSYIDYDGIETCNNCGCKFRVISYKQAGHNEPEEYQCPDCKKVYLIRACNTPTVQKISDRTDGKNDIFHNGI